jgi:two-component system chemotaxis response regulator CheB
LPAAHARTGEPLQPGRIYVAPPGCHLACPECGGALAEAALPHITYYRCHVGHQFGPQSLAAAQAEAAEAKLWAAVAALEETAALARHLAARTDVGENPASQRNGTVKWAAELAETVRAQMRAAPESDTSH